VCFGPFGDDVTGPKKTINLYNIIINAFLSIQMMFNFQDTIILTVLTFPQSFIQRLCFLNIKTLFSYFPLKFWIFFQLNLAHVMLPLLPNDTDNSTRIPQNEQHCSFHTILTITRQWVVQKVCNAYKTKCLC
jgi:hypothetical protein